MPGLPLFWRGNEGEAHAKRNLHSADPLTATGRLFNAWTFWKKIF